MVKPHTWSGANLGGIRDFSGYCHGAWHLVMLMLQMAKDEEEISGVAVGALEVLLNETALRTLRSASQTALHAGQ